MSTNEKPAGLVTTQATHLVTSEFGFDSTNTDAHLLAVRAGVSAQGALTRASDLIAQAHDIIHHDLEETPDRYFGALSLLDVAKALIESVERGCAAQEGGAA